MNRNKKDFLYFFLVNQDDGFLAQTGGYDAFKL